MKMLLYGEHWEGTHVDCISKVLAEKHIPFRIFDFFSLLSYHTGSVFADKVLRRLNYAGNERLINRLLLKELETYRPDVLFISKGINIFPETLQLFRQRSVLIVNWNPDDFFNRLNSSSHLRASFGLYDYVFSARKHLFDAYRSAGIKNPVYLEWYYIPWLHKMPETKGEPADKITFIGTHSKRREAILQNIHPAFPVEVWGAGWTLSSLRFRKNIRLKDQVLKQSDFPGIISRSLVNLNILTKENQDQTNLKLFEITASYGLLLTEKNDATVEILGNDCFYYEYENPSSSNLNDRLQYIFDSDKNAMAGKRNDGYDRIMHGHHSINDRVQTLLNTITGK